MLSFIALAAETAGTGQTNILEEINKVFPGGLENILINTLGISAILAFGVLIVAGVSYSLSGGNDTRKKDAIDWIKAVFGGLALLSLGFVIIKVINPRILQPQIIVKESLNRMIEEIQLAESDSGIINGLSEEEWGDSSNKSARSLLGVGDWEVVEATAYNSIPNQTDSDPYTPADGVRFTEKTGWGMIASDPCLIPLGTTLKMEAVDSRANQELPSAFREKILTQVFKVRDTGGDIKKRRIDIWFPKAKSGKPEQYALDFGRRSMRIKIIKCGKPKSSCDPYKIIPACQEEWVMEN